MSKRVLDCWIRLQKHALAQPIVIHRRNDGTLLGYASLFLND